MAKRPGLPSSLPAFTPEAGKRIGEVADSVGGNSALARICGVSESSVRNWRAGKAEPGATDLLEIARAGDVTPEWLIEGVEPKRRGAMSKLGFARDAVVRFQQRRSTVPMQDAATLLQEAAEYQLDVDALEQRHGDRYPKPDVIGDFVMLPLYDVGARAGSRTSVSSGAEHPVDVLAFKRDWIRRELRADPADLRLIYVEGDSMAPDLRPGDIVLIDHTDTTARHDALYVIRMDDAVLVKQLQRLPGGMIKVVSKNEAYEPFTVPAARIAGDDDSFAIVGRVVWGCRRF